MVFQRRIEKILVFELNQQRVFCGMDATRVIFSPYLHIDYLPEQHFDGRGGIQETTITLRSNEEVAAEGIIVFAGEPRTCTLLGWDEFFATQPSIDQPRKVTTWNASWFSPGDVIEITKDDWEESESSMDHVLSQRTLGSSFAEVFFTQESIITQLSELFSVPPVELGSKKVVFETYPGDSLKKFF